MTVLGKLVTVFLIALSIGLYLYGSIEKGTYFMAFACFLQTLRDD